MSVPAGRASAREAKDFLLWRRRGFFFFFLLLERSDLRHPKSFFLCVSAVFSDFCVRFLFFVFGEMGFVVVGSIFMRTVRYVAFYIDADMAGTGVGADMAPLK